MSYVLVTGQNVTGSIRHVTVDPSGLLRAEWSPHMYKLYNLHSHKKAMKSLGVTIY